MSIRHVESPDMVLACKVAFLQEVCEPDGSWWLYYTVGADLAPKIDYYTKQGWALGDAVETGLYSGTMNGEAYSPKPWEPQNPGMPINKRPIVKPDKAANPEQALADADGENEFPRAAADEPVCYTRGQDGQVWLVYQRGLHLREVLAKLWATGKAVSKVEVVCTALEGEPPNQKEVILTHKGIPVYRRLILPKDHPLALNPSKIPLPKPQSLSVG